MTFGDDDLRAMEGAALPSPIHPAVAGVPVVNPDPSVYDCPETYPEAFRAAPVRGMPERFTVRLANAGGSGEFWAAREGAHPNEEGFEYHAVYLRADLALPRPWRTAEDLEALPVGSVVRCASTGHVYVREFAEEFGWYGTGGADIPTSARGIAHRGDGDEVGGLILHIPAAP